MKRIFRKSNIFSFVLGAIIFGSIGALASGILASDITYKETTVDKALDDLYTTASDYVKLENETTVSSSNLLNGVTAYDNLGNLITGNVSTDCVEGIYTKPSNSQVELDFSFVPTKFYIYYFGPASNLKTVVFYDIDNIDSKIYMVTPTNNGTSSVSGYLLNNTVLTSTYGINGNGYKNSVTYNYIACK